MSTLSQAAIEALGHYVYRLIDPRQDDGKGTFYIGKGYGARAHQHASDALTHPTPSDKLTRIKDIHADGLQVKIIIHRHGLDEGTAFHVEAALIDAYSGLTNLIAGHKSELGASEFTELVQRLDAPPAVFDFPAILITIEKEWRDDLTPEQLYERTRRYWVCNPARHSTRPTRAIAVYRGLIREVYKIDAWELYTEWPEDRDTTRISDADEMWPKDQVRRGFMGEPDHEWVSLKCLSVRHLQKKGNQNPIRYVNC